MGGGENKRGGRGRRGRGGGEEWGREGGRVKVEGGVGCGGSVGMMKSEGRWGGEYGRVWRNGGSRESDGDEGGEEGGGPGRRGGRESVRKGRGGGG